MAMNFSREDLLWPRPAAAAAAAAEEETDTEKTWKWLGNIWLLATRKWAYQQQFRNFVFIHKYLLLDIYP